MLANQLIILIIIPSSLHTGADTYLSNIMACCQHHAVILGFKYLVLSKNNIWHVDDNIYYLHVMCTLAKGKQ